MNDPMLVALDVDGTVLIEDGTISDAVLEAVQHAAGIGHEVTLATGRSPSMTLPVLERLRLTPEFVVCSNGAVTLRRDEHATVGYTRDRVETFSPRNVLETVNGHLDNARFAVEDEEGVYRYAGGRFPDGSLGATSMRVDFDDLLDIEATRVVVLSPEHDTEEFLEIVERMGLHRVTYNVGWTAWLDIAPDGVNKATALERVRQRLGIPRSRLLAIGDGRNDIDMLTWASAEGRGVAMGQAPPEVREAAGESTGTDLDDGAAAVLRALT
jgi:Cof subfamily protein (haloacid dehalogenase superfamily)